MSAAETFLRAMKFAAARGRPALETVHYLRTLLRQWWLILITLIGMVLYGMVLGLERLLVVRDARIQ